MNRTFIISLVIDYQQGFSENCPNELPVPGALACASEIQKINAIANYKIATKDWHPINALWESNEEHPQLSPIEGYPNLDVYWKRHCIADTFGSQLIDPFKDEDFDFIVRKGQHSFTHPYGAFYNDLQETYRTTLNEESPQIIGNAFFQGYNNILIVYSGLAEDYCVYTTMMQSIKLFKHNEEIRHCLIHKATVPVNEENCRPGSGRFDGTQYKLSQAINNPFVFQYSTVDEMLEILVGNWGYYRFYQ